jgi:hypothetical protein
MLSESAMTRAVFSILGSGVGAAGAAVGCAAGWAFAGAGVEVGCVEFWATGVAVGACAAAIGVFVGVAVGSSPPPPQAVMTKAAKIMTITNSIVLERTRGCSNVCIWITKVNSSI